MDKNKIKNIALGVSLGLNILLGFFLGGGLISSCAAKKPVEASSSVSALSDGEFIEPSQKRALNPDATPSEYPNLWDSLESRLSGQGLVYAYGGNTYYDGRTANSHIQIKRLPRAGLYYVDIEWASDGSDGGFGLISVDGINAIGENADQQVVITPYVSKYRVLGYLLVDENMANSGGFFVSCQPYDMVKPKVYFIDGDYLPASERVTFPRNFFPWQIWGNRATDVLIGGPSVTSGTIAESQTLTFADLLFRSNGRIYKGIMLVFSYRPGQRLGKYDPTGDIYANGTIVYSSSNPPWFLSGMLYIPAETGVDADRVLTANFAQLGDNMLLMPNPIWSKDAYRTIDILDASDASMTGVPSGVGTNTPMEWLNIVAAAESIAATNSVTDPFTMLGNGFTAVGNILTIPILPFMTLGTLIAVPLIVLVILAILRLLAK